MRWASFWPTTTVNLARADRLINCRAEVRAGQSGHSRQPRLAASTGAACCRAALPLLERAFRLDQDGDIGAHWGEVLWALGEKTKARETWNRALMADPDNALVKAAQKRAGVPSLPSHGHGHLDLSAHARVAGRGAAARC